MGKNMSKGDKIEKHKEKEKIKEKVNNQLQKNVQKKEIKIDKAENLENAQKIQNTNEIKIKAETPKSKIKKDDDNSIISQNDAPEFLKGRSGSANSFMEKKGKIKLQTTGGSLNKDIREIYKFKEILGGGHFGTVRVAYKKNSNEKKKFAIKSISKKNLTEKDLLDLMKEVEILSSLDHPNIIHFYETYHDQYYFHIVMELCTGKEVFDRIIEEGVLNEQKVCQIIYKVLHAISYCHEAGITHRDLKPENILFETQEPDAEIKLIDFGLSRKYDINEKMHTVLGTPYYVSPEVLKGEYDQKCDVWSIGVLAYIMLSGEPPFKGDSNNEIFEKIMTQELKFNKEKWKKVSDEAKDFIKQCMVKRPEQRFKAAKAIEHPWFKNIHLEIHSTQRLNQEILENLRNFSTPQKFKRMVLRFLVNSLNQKEIKLLRDAFFAIDLDHTGHISTEELGKAFKLAGIEISDEEVQNILESADDYDNGKLNYSEFLVASLNQKNFLDKEKLVNAFKYFDIDRSGYIDSHDIKNALLRSGKHIINQEEVDKIIEEVGEDKQKISLSEFLKIFGCE